MKRLHIISKPIKMADLADLETQEYEDKWLFEAEKRQIKRLRRFRHLLTTQ